MVVALANFLMPGNYQLPSSLGVRPVFIAEALRGADKFNSLEVIDTHASWYGHSSNRDRILYCIPRCTRNPGDMPLEFFADQEVIPNHIEPNDAVAHCDW